MAKPQCITILSGLLVEIHTPRIHMLPTPHLIEEERLTQYLVSEASVRGKASPIASGVMIYTEVCFICLHRSARYPLQQFKWLWSGSECNSDSDGHAGSWLVSRFTQVSHVMTVSLKTVTLSLLVCSRACPLCRFIILPKLPHEDRTIIQ